VAKKPSGKLYDITRKLGKIAQITNDVEDVATGKVDKVVKRHIKRSIRKKSNKTLSDIFKNFGL
jgi:hypothetical protein